MPFIPEDVLKMQRVEIYLNDLKARLSVLRSQHDEVIHSSVKMIKEIDEVSSTLLSTSNTCGEQMTKIKKLILEFETANDTSSKHTPVVLENNTNVRKVLENFERLNESHHLKDSLTFLRKAKESLEKIDSYLEGGLVDLKRINVSERIRDKINMFNTKEKPCSELSEKSSSLACEFGPGKFASQKFVDQAAAKQRDLNIYESNEPNNSSSKDKLDTISDNVTELSKKSSKFVDEFGLAKCPSQKLVEETASRQRNLNTYESNEPNNSNNREKSDTISNYVSCCSSLASFTTCRNSLNGYEGDNDDSEFDMFAVRNSRN